MKVIILAGGSGTRLWPLSRTHYPKQFLKLKGMEHSIFQLSLLRALKLCGIEDIVFVTGKDYAHLISGQVEELGLTVGEKSILLEPESKNTLPAIAYAVKTMDAPDSEEIVVFPSDHLIEDVDLLTETIHAAREAIKQNIVVFGIVPSAPETGYGYIKPGKPIGACFHVEDFKEKPDLDTARRYVECGYYWNGGMFLFEKGLFISLLEETCPEVLAAFDGDDINECFARCPSVSIDYGLLEKTSQIAVMPFCGDWNDLGSFTTLYSRYDTHQDECGNVCFNNDIMVDSANNLVYSDSNKAVALIGINDLVVIDQKDALLVCRKDETQRVKEVAEKLRARHDARADNHMTEYRQWGSCTFLESNTVYRVNRLTLLPQKHISYQMHYHRSEHWVVLEGTGELTINGESRMLFNGESVYIPAGTKHRLKNPGRMLLIIIEIQSGRYLGEDDIVHFEYDYERQADG